jgi:hypothetical protein
MKKRMPVSTVVRAQFLPIALAAALCPVAASAHHSFASFDMDKEIAIAGTVKDYQWTNPHSWIQILVPDGAGAAKEWSIEMSGPSLLVKMGWRPKTLRAGDKVRLLIHPRRDGRNGGSIINATLADGRTLGMIGAGAVRAKPVAP